ncbi:LysR family transcriptional regulator [Pollutimonas subterranea]|uniref:LysR family transcriptional regulator n=1 Tax=Pollutimonas subterranea TaxID=2045210 RepID=A0A2N4U258_9BURK|nr:LysR family transcriptional regulator [Pollutimonas subterranea]PLC49096.1 LysR family transcriptional regulator [Pollutimonas subterranea]
MNIQTLTVFVTVAREGSLTRAAQKLHITQPAVGLHIKKLQEQTGLRLLMRTAQGMELTPDGSALLPLAEKVLQSQSSFKIAAHQLSKEIRGRLRIGTILDPEFIRLGVLLKGLLSRNQYLEIVLAHGMSGEVLQRVMDAELDAGFYLSIPDSVQALPDTILCKTLNQFAYKVLAPTGWESQVRDKDWHQLAALPWLATPPASAHHRLLALVFGPQSLTGLDVNYVALVDQEASMIDLVKSGVGLSLVRDHIALREAQAHGLAIADMVSLSCSLSFVCLRERMNDPPVAAALMALEEVWPNT